MATIKVPKTDVIPSPDQELLTQLQEQMARGASFTEAVDTVTFNAEPYLGLKTAMQRSIFPPSPVPVLSPV